MVRNLASRDGWAKQWTAFMEQPLVPAPAKLKFASGLDAGRLMSAAELGVAGDPKPEAMKGVEGGCGRCSRMPTAGQLPRCTFVSRLAPTTATLPATVCRAGGESRARELLDSFLGGRAAGCEWAGQRQRCMFFACIAAAARLC